MPAQQQRVQRIASEARWSRYLLWGVLTLAVAGLAWMAWRMSVQLRADRGDAWRRSVNAKVSSENIDL